MFWKAGSTVYDSAWPQAVTAEQAAWRLRAMHYSTLSLVHGYNRLDNGGLNETIDRWSRTGLNLSQVILISSTFDLFDLDFYFDSILILISIFDLDFDLDLDLDL